MEVTLFSTYCTHDLQ